MVDMCLILGIEVARGSVALLPSDGQKTLLSQNPNTDLCLLVKL